MGELSLNNFIVDREDGFVVACILKAFFREMTHPLITYDFYDEIFKIMSEFLSLSLKLLKWITKDAILI